LRDLQRAVDRIRLAAESLGRLYHPQAADLVLAGRVLSYWSRLHGRVRLATTARTF